MRAAGYSLLINRLPISAVALSRPAIVQPVTRIERIGNTLAVPQRMAPSEDDLLGNVLFALKHEGVNLSILAQALPQIPASLFSEALKASPNGVYIRKACYLREAFTGENIEQPSPVRGAFVKLFDPEHYITRPGDRNSKWRLEFNGLGDLHYCATVERTPEVTELLEHDILGKAKRFMVTLPPLMIDRAINWAYLHETQDSFAIEKEAPTEDKSRRFIKLLRQAHDRHPLTEDYLVTLQNATVANPLDLAAAFRHEQNHLSNGMHGAAGVTYVPPPPDLCRELVESLMRFANEGPTQIDPLVAAGIISFGFVFLHPFMDGNGRLSRFLIHQALCLSGALENGLLLPVSVGMKREERMYLETLQGYSGPVREFWQVHWIDHEQFTFEFKGADAIYRFWDATSCVVFTCLMAKRALEVELRDETAFLENYDAVFRAVDERFDVRGSDLANLVMMCLNNGGIVSNNRRKQYLYRVPEKVFDFIELTAQQVLAAQRAAGEERQDIGPEADH
ncbi:Fic family protein [Pseudomonas putida]|uniref:Fic family protein n=1 Tax=Pseudomonas putida TaxID=303 RepID=UPI0018D9995D|nr:Fic family protein [Pseudomonas putida]MBH3417945.1 Fic family protein [Pseudomonas putida]MDG9817179.1 Fic family protein [Pseudomonas putida]